MWWGFIFIYFVWMVWVYETFWMNVGSFSPRPWDLGACFNRDSWCSLHVSKTSMAKAPCFGHASLRDYWFGGETLPDQRQWTASGLRYPSPWDKPGGVIRPLHMLRRERPGDWAQAMFQTLSLLFKLVYYNLPFSPFSVTADKWIPCEMLHRVACLLLLPLLAVLLYLACKHTN